MRIDIRTGLVDSSDDEEEEKGSEVIDSSDDEEVDVPKPLTLVDLYYPFRKVLRVVFFVARQAWNVFCRTSVSGGDLPPVVDDDR